MNNKIQKVIEESNKEFNEKFPWLNVLSVTHHYEEDREKAQFLEKIVKTAQEDIKSHISQTIYKVLSAIEEEVEGKKVDLRAGYANGRSKFGLKNNQGYNSALSHIKVLLKQAKENIK